MGSDASRFADKERVEERDALLKEKRSIFSRNDAVIKAVLSSANDGYFVLLRAMLTIAGNVAHAPARYAVYFGRRLRYEYHEAVRHLRYAFAASLHRFLGQNWLWLVVAVLAALLAKLGAALR